MGNEVNPTDSARRLQQIREVVDDCHRRRADGEPLSDDLVIEQHPDLMPELEQELHMLRLATAARQQAASDPVSQNDTTRSIDDTSTAPTLVGDYEILEELGRGGMGIVYRAKHRRMDRLIALKLMSSQVTGSGDVVAQRFEREVRTLAQLSHPNIAAAYDAGDKNGHLYLAMELLDGENLRDLVTADGPLSLRQAIDYVRQAADGLRYVHELNVVHRDVKPANLFVDRRGVVKILDFGLAALQENWQESQANEQLTQSGQIVGTCDFVAPEQIADSKNVDHRADIYGLGCTLYYLLNGQPPFGRGTVYQRLLAHREQDMPSLGPAATTELEEVYRRMTQRSPDDRYPTMRDVVDDLEGLVDRAGDPVEVPRAKREPRRLPFKFGPVLPLVSLGALLVIAAVAWRIWNVSPPGIVFRIEEPASAKLVEGVIRNVGIVVRHAGSDEDHRLSDLEVDLQRGRYTIDLDRLPVGLQVADTEFDVKTRGRQAIRVSFSRARVSNADFQKVIRQLIELNPGYDGHLDYEEAADRDWPIVGFGDRDCVVNLEGAAQVNNLWPLAGIDVSKLRLNGTNVVDLSPLEGMRMWHLDVTSTPVSDLTPIANLPLTDLFFSDTQVSDLDAIVGMRLDSLGFAETAVSDLEPLRTMTTLIDLDCSYTSVSDLSPIKGLVHLSLLSLDGPAVTDLSMLQEFPELVELKCDPKLAWRFADMLKAMSALQTINEQDKAEFWRTSQPADSTD